MHPSVADRQADGRARRKLVPRSSHAEWAPGDGPPGPRRRGRGGQRRPPPGAGADPPRPHGHQRVRLLPGHGRHHGGRPRHHPDQRPPGPDLWRRPPGQLRLLPFAGPAARLRPQRLRRDPGRPLGVGRQAPGRQLRRLCPPLRPRPERRGPGRPQGHRGVPHRHARVRRRPHAGRLVRPPRGRRDRRPAARGDAQAGGEPGPVVERARQHPGVEEADRGGRRRAPDPQRTTGAGPPPRHRRHRVRSVTRTDVGHRRRRARRATAAASPPTARCSSTASTGSTWPSRSWASAVSAPAAGSCSSRAATPTTRSSCRSRRPAAPSSRTTSPAPASAMPVGASSRASS